MNATELILNLSKAWPGLKFELLDLGLSEHSYLWGCAVIRPPAPRMRQNMVPSIVIPSWRRWRWIVSAPASSPLAVSWSRSWRTRSCTGCEVRVGLACGRRSRAGRRYRPRLATGGATGGPAISAPRTAVRSRRRSGLGWRFDQHFSFAHAPTAAVTRSQFPGIRHPFWCAVDARAGAR